MEGGGGTWAFPEVQGSSEAVGHDAGPLGAEAAREVAQVAGPRIPHTLLTHPQPCMSMSPNLACSHDSGMH